MIEAVGIRRMQPYSQTHIFSSLRAVIQMLVYIYISAMMCPSMPEAVMFYYKTSHPGIPYTNLVKNWEQSQQEDTGLR
jgi:hypothetical protein